jgi:peptidoglycan hydrolase-like protein with peptidoglycan-binding domain
MTRIDRREFSLQLAQQGGRINVDALPPPVLRQLESAGVDLDRLRSISGDDRVLEGAEINELYTALAVRGSGGARVDNGVSEDLFRGLASRVERPDGSTGAFSSSARGRSVGIGGGNVDEATELRGRTDGTRPGWFGAAMESIAEFFVELFTSNDYITSAERDFDIGRQLAREHPETLRATLAEPTGEQMLRDRLMGQRPATTSEGDWRRTVDDVIRGMQRTLSTGTADLPDSFSPSSSLRLRDAATPLFAANADPGARRELELNMNALAGSGLPEQTQVRLLNDWNTAGRPASFRPNMTALSGALASSSTLVRQAATEELAAHPDRMARLSSLMSSDAFRSPHLTDADRIALIRSGAGTTADVTAMARLLSSETGRALAPETRAAMITGFNSNPANAVRALETLTANPGFSRVSAAVQQDYVRLMLNPATTAAQSTPALARLSAAHTGNLAPLNEVLFGTRTLQTGSTGADVRTAQRYLRTLGYDGIVGPEESTTFGANTRAAVAEFQRRHGLLDGTRTEGVIDQATYRAMVAELQARGISPTDYRFTTELSLNRPTRASDGPWRATQRWTPELQAEFSRFAAAYTAARIPANPDGTARLPEWGERVDCADLSYEALIQFARQRGLPVHLSSGSTTYSNRSSGPIVGGVQSNFGAMHLQTFTTPLREGELPRSGDIGNMRWAQSANGHDSSYWHSHNIINFDPLFRKATVIFGSLDDLMKQPALDTFNRRGFDLTLHDVPERTIIDGINDDSGQGRQVDRATQEQRVRRLLEAHTTGGHAVSDADVSAFIALVGNDANIHRNAPTAVSMDADAFDGLVSGAPFADPAARRAAVAELNTRFGASFTEADLDRLIAAGDRGEAGVRAEATRIVNERVPAARRAGAAEALMESTRPVIRFHADRDALADRGLRASAIRDFNSTYGSRVTDADLGNVLNAGDREAALAVATTIVASRGVPVDRRADAARDLVDAADSTRRFRRWDFDMFNRHM